MIVITGAAGFIGSNVIADLEAACRGPLVAVDWFGSGDKWRNLAKRRINAFVAPTDLQSFLADCAPEIESVIHMGAISATTERDVDRLIALNIKYTVDLWDWCASNEVRFVYASSAATYGALETGFVDENNLAQLGELRPLNAYGWSKKAVDEIIASRVAAGSKVPPQWVGLKFFNVYGPNEYHKGDMQSVALKLYEAVQSGAPVRLFKSYRPNIAHGEQKRDFIYVRDCTRAIMWILANPGVSGIFNLGTGTARSFRDIVKSLEVAIERPIDFEFVDMPDQLRGTYQYFTRAEMSRLTAKGMDFRFVSLEEGIADYVKAFLSREDRYR
jgi:ADP-L-glycero-D-manno-heptose 6-epimerase